MLTQLGTPVPSTVPPPPVKRGRGRPRKTPVPPPDVETALAVEAANPEEGDEDTGRKARYPTRKSANEVRPGFESTSDSETGEATFTVQHMKAEMVKPVLLFLQSLPESRENTAKTIKNAYKASISDITEFKRAFPLLEIGDKWTEDDRRKARKALETNSQRKAMVNVRC